MLMKYLRIIGPKPKQDRAESAAADPAGSPPANPGRGADRGLTPSPGWGVYITHDPAQCRTPEDPEQARALAAHSVAEIYDYVYAWADRAGQTLAEARIQEMVANAEAWLEARDQEYLEYLDQLIDAAVEAADTAAAANAAGTAPPEPEQEP